MTSIPLWVTVGLPALFFFGMGVQALARPQSITKMFGLPQVPADSRTEVRSVYGGFGLAAGAVLVWAWQHPGAEAKGVYLATAVAFAGWAGGRLVGAVIERSTTFFPTWFFFLEELVLGACCFFAWRS